MLSCACKKRPKGRAKGRGWAGNGNGKRKEVEKVMEKEVARKGIGGAEGGAVGNGKLCDACWLLVCLLNV